MQVDYRTAPDTEARSAAIELTQANKAIVRRFLAEGITSDDVLLYTDLLTTDHVQTGPAPYQEFRGIDGCLGYFAGLLTAFPDLEIRVSGMMGMGDQVLAFGTMHGRHSGAFVLGDSVFAPTGRDASWKYTVGCRIENGKIAETQLGLNKAGLMRQLGLSFSD